MTWLDALLNQRESGIRLTINPSPSHDGVDAGGEVVHAEAELVVVGEHGSFVGEAGSLVLQFFSAGGDFGGAALNFG